MGNLFVKEKDCSEIKPTVKRPQGVGWKPPGERSGSKGYEHEYEYEHVYEYEHEYEYE